MHKPRLVRALGFLVAVLYAAMPGSSALAAGHKPAEITVGYFQQWPTPSLFAQAKQTFDYVLGLKVNWVVFANGSDMNTAMAAGDVQIAYSLGHVPFLVGVSGGLDLTMVAVAVGYPGNDNCIVHGDAGITRDRAAQLEGRKVAIQAGSVSHFRLLKMLAHLRVDAAKVDIQAMKTGAVAAEALRQGEVVMACAAGSALRSMTELGSPLLTGLELEQIGLRLFDTVTVPTAFMNEHAEIVQAFIDVTEAANQQWMINPDAMRAVIARAAQMDRESSNQTLEGFSFPLVAEQKSDAWMAARVAAYTKEIADFFVVQGRLEKSLDSYEAYITTRFLR